MNYTIIAHTSYHDRCGDYTNQPGSFDKWFFRDDREAFIKIWAELTFENKYDELVIMLNGVPDDELFDEDFDEYDALRDEMYIAQKEVKLEHDKAEAIRRDAAANAAVEKARQIAHMERQRDLQQFETLKRKLGKS